MGLPLISVIVPVYKAEDYLERCVNSIRNQTYRNLEIILVNDGSPDRCGEMCDRFAQEDARIRVFHKENGGQSSARNLGLDHMTGEYVGFVDSDDWIELDMYRHLYELLAGNHAQISCCGCQLDGADGSVSWLNAEYQNDTSVKVYNTLEALKQSIWNTVITYSLCDKLFEADIFDGLRMSVGKIYEDQEIIPKCIERAKTVAYDPEPYYHYRLTAESTTRGELSPRRFIEIDIAHARALEYQEKYPELYPATYRYLIEDCLSVLPLSKGVESCKERHGEVVRFLQKSADSEMMKVLPRKTCAKLRLLKIGEPVYFLLVHPMSLPAVRRAKTIIKKIIRKAP